MENLGRPLHFAASAVIASVVLDLLLWGVYQGFEPRAHFQSLLVVHATMHLSLFAAVLTGGFIALFVLPRTLLLWEAVVILGLWAGALASFVSAFVWSVAGAELAFIVAVGVSVLVLRYGRKFVSSKSE